jgi:asparagine synthase (glutamine-hydrolysing)
MCGICGEIGFDSKTVSTESVTQMMEMMVRRGPDAEGLFRSEQAVFGHRRLKIMDLSDGSHQPMIDSDSGLVLVYNGAIYNYPELKRELEDKGYRFHSTGDTEVVLKAYQAWGQRCVERFNGMFAFAVWDPASKRTFLARDRLGIKPLYYTEWRSKLRFASSLPALLVAGDVDTAIDPIALHHYMTFHSVVPAPRTILKGVRKLPSGCTMSIAPDGSRRINRYWELRFTRDAEEARYKFEDWRRLLQLELINATKRRLVADVPVGVLLSGGVDSSLVVGLLAQAGQRDLSTFSIGFESVNGEKGDEFEYSDVVAQYFGTQHHKILVDGAEGLDLLAPTVAAMTEPMVSHDCIGFYRLSQEVSQHVKAVQSGQGADEVLAGYDWYPPLLNSDNVLDDYASVFFDRDHAEFARAVDPRFVNGDTSRKFAQDHFQRAAAEQPVDSALHMDTTVMLVDDPVKRVDNMTMAWGLEARVPFLDHELVELAARIPAEHKVKGGGKYILKDFARSVIPASVIDRPKGYFPVPGLKYLQGDYLDFVRDLLTGQRARERALFNSGYVGDLLADPKSHITPLRGSKLWQVALLEYWLQIHNIETERGERP